MNALPLLNMTLGNRIARRRLCTAARRNEGKGENRTQPLFILKRRRTQTAVMMAPSISPNLAWPLSQCEIDLNARRVAVCMYVQHVRLKTWWKEREGLVWKTIVKK